MQAARNHQMNYQPDIAFDTDCDALADTLQFPHHPAFRVGNGRLEGSQEKWRANANLFELLPPDAGFES